VLYNFGSELQLALGVPVGLVESPVGGTPAESWISREAQYADPAPVESTRAGDEVYRDLDVPRVFEKNQRAQAR